MKAANEPTQTTHVDACRNSRSRFGIFRWTAAGMLLGLLAIPVLGSFWERYPALVPPEFLNAPADAMLRAWTKLSLGPHVDAGFILFLVFPMIQFAAYGLITGFLAGALFHMKINGNSKLAQAILRLRSRKWKSLGLVAAIGIVVTGALCIRQEVAYGRDREFFLTHVDHKSFAEACLKMVINPDEFNLEIGSYPGNAPNLPEVIRNLKAETVVFRGYGISVSRAVYFQQLTFSHSESNPDEYRVQFESNYQSPLALYTLQSNSRPKFDY